MNKSWENILLIAGTRRNVGKTTFTCQLLETVKDLSPIAIKTTPHFHDETSGLKLLSENQGYRLFEETNQSTNKDSSLFLQRGAHRSFYLQAKDEYLDEGFIALFPYLEPEKPILIESAALHKYMQPGLFLVVYMDKDLVKPSSAITMKIADKTIQSDGKTFSPSPSIIKFEKKWSIRK
ncbi:hypothetical protein ACUNWD_16695 [Sunxiuqinia sp. A32]|uniref:hypothetical protein n=1 Tax=Sunxiuqinia sp. A32 TaxID=3461496 RepID=UPI0040459449